MQVLNPEHPVVMQSQATRNLHPLY